MDSDFFRQNTKVNIVILSRPGSGLFTWYKAGPGFMDQIGSVQGTAGDQAVFPETYLIQCPKQGSEGGLTVWNFV